MYICMYMYMKRSFALLEFLCYIRMREYHNFPYLLKRFEKSALPALEEREAGFHWPKIRLRV